MSCNIVILAGGVSRRMLTQTPKVLMRVGNASMLEHVVALCPAVQPARTGKAQPPILVVNPEIKELISFARKHGLSCVKQPNPLGTAHAVGCASAKLKAERTLVLFSDMPLLQPASLKRLLQQTPDDALGLLSAELADPAQYGRIIRNRKGAVQNIVEHADANLEQRLIREIFTGVLLLPTRWLKTTLKCIQPDNQQGEYYLTDLVALALQDGVDVKAIKVGDVREAEGANDLHQLARIEKHWQVMNAENLLKKGLYIADPNRFDLRGQLQKYGVGCSVDINVIMEGNVRLGKNVHIGANCLLRDVNLGDNTRVLPNSILEGVDAGKDCKIGPYARLRSPTKLGKGVQIGNFVETKNTRLGAGTKANHLAYLGDLTAGARVNIGAGTIHCNYDGKKKHQSKLGDDVFIGSNSALIGPIHIGKGAYIAAGSTVSKSVPAKSLAIGRARQRHVDNWNKD